VHHRKKLNARFFACQARVLGPEQSLDDMLKRVPELSVKGGGYWRD